jgi:hypothetical protein
MITQAIKRWLHKIFGWLSGKASAEAEYAHAEAPLNPGATSEQITRPALDGAIPPNGVAPLISGLGETSCSTLDERLDRKSPPPSTPPLEKIELPATPPPVPTTPPVETAAGESATAPSGASSAPPALPTPEQKLEFLHFLVRRGIVNEGFVEEQIPRQYRQEEEL